MQRIAIITLLGSLSPLLVNAQCTLGDGTVLNCGDFSSSQNPQGDLSCGVDPQDFANSLALGLNVCQCEDSTYTIAATFTGTDEQVTTTSAYASLPSSDPVYTQVPFNYDEVYSSLPVGSDVTFNIVRTRAGQEESYGAYSFNFQPITSIYSETTTETAQEVGPATTTTSTETATFTETTSAPQATVTSNCATGTKTVYAPKVTFKPILKKPAATTTYTVVKLSIKTTVLSCIPTGFPFKLPFKLFPRAPEGGFERRQAPAPTYEQAYCPAVSGPPMSTTYTSTELTTVTSTPVETTTETTTSVTTVTQAPNPATTTICKNCKTTKTVTPTITIPIIITPPKIVIKKTVTKAVTITLSPLKPKLCAPPTTTKKPLHLPTGWIPLLPWIHKPVTTTRK